MKRDMAAEHGTAAFWAIRGACLTLERPLIMGVLNATPDSFSDGGQFATTAVALDHARRLIDEGADLLDIGGESTRPGAGAVPVDVELQRVLPLVEALVASDVPLSVDTSKPEVMRAALAAGAAIINDVLALRAPGALEAVADSGCGVVLMHMQGSPRTMQISPEYGDVVHEVKEFLRARVEALGTAGIAPARVALDPGFGFGKSAAHNFALLHALPAFTVLGRPLLVGLSRKSMLGGISGRPPGERVHASVAAALLAVERGARIVRVHDVAATRDALQVWQALHAASERDGGAQ